jgi:hypothetical protein
MTTDSSNKHRKLKVVIFLNTGCSKPVSAKVENRLSRLFGAQDA